MKEKNIMTEMKGINMQLMQTYILSPSAHNE